MSSYSRKNRQPLKGVNNLKMENNYSALSSKQNFSVGIIGAGYVSKKYHAPIISNLPGTKIKWVGDIDFKQAKQITSLYSGRAVDLTNDSGLPSADVVLLATPVTHREPYLNELSGSNTAILCEKPFATSGSEHEMFDQYDNKVAVNYLRTYFSPIQQLKSLFESGLIKWPEKIHIRRGTVGGGTGGNSGSYRTQPEAGGILIERGCHTLSQIVHLFSGCDFHINSAAITKFDRVDVQFSAELLVEGPSKEFIIDYQQSLLQNYERGIKLNYPLASVKIDHLDATDSISLIKQDEINGKKLECSDDNTWATSTKQGHIFSWLEFIEYVETGKHHLGENPTLPRVTEIIEKIRTQGEKTEINHK